jgi:SNF2 family DNA or RNA helicase
MSADPSYDSALKAPHLGEGGQNLPAALVGPRLGIDYLPHQEIGVRWMLGREEPTAPICRGGILGDDMGLGKTFQTIGLLKNSPEVMPTLIICPPVLMAGWTEELKACGYTVSILMGSSAWSIPPGADPATTVWLTTYPKACLYHRFIATTEPAFARVVLDEGHIIRNGKATSRWVNCMAIGSRATCRWILSATPVQNGYNDWRNLCWWLRVKCPNSQIPEIGPTVMLRRTMDELRETIDALPAPPRFVAHDLQIPAAGATLKEARLFHALCDQLDSVMDSKTVSALIKLELYLRIQQFLVHPQIYVESMRTKFKRAYPRPDWTGSATKWSAVMAELQKGVDAKVGQIVFCNFRQEIDRVCEEASALGAAVFAIRGGMGVEKVGNAVTEARAAAGEGKAVVVVVQIVSGGAGLNLQFCSRIHFLSQHWNPAVVHQAVGRAVRIGQRAVVDVHMYRVVDDVFDNLDRRMIQVHMAKIAGAREICGTLYEGYAPLKEIPSKRLEEETDEESASVGAESLVDPALVAVDEEEEEEDQNPQ